MSTGLYSITPRPRGQHADPSADLTGPSKSSLAHPPTSTLRKEQCWWLLVLKFPVPTKGCMLRGRPGATSSPGLRSVPGRGLRLGFVAPDGPAGPHPGVKPSAGSPWDCLPVGLRGNANQSTDAMLNITQRGKKHLCVSVLYQLRGETSAWINTHETMAFSPGPGARYASTSGKEKPRENNA